MVELPQRLGLGERVGWGGFSGNHQGKVNGISQVNGGHKFGTHLPRAGCVHKGTLAPVSASFPGESRFNL